MHQNKWFIGIQFIIIAGQVMIIFVGGQAFSVTRLNGAQWGISLVLGLLPIPVAVIIRLIPDELIRKVIPIWTHKQGPQLLVSDEDRHCEWYPRLEEIGDHLSFLKTVRGGRLKNLRYKLQHPVSLITRSRSGSRSRNNSISQTPVGDQAQDPTSPTAVTHESPGHGGLPVKRGHEETVWVKPSRLHLQEGIEVHPETREDDPIIAEWYLSSNVHPSQNPDLTPVFPHAPSN
jgi:Ca2+-transporting ATPase